MNRSINLKTKIIILMCLWYISYFKYFEINIDEINGEKIYNCIWQVKMWDV